MLIFDVIHVFDDYMFKIIIHFEQTNIIIVLYNFKSERKMDNMAHSEFLSK